MKRLIAVILLLALLCPSLSAAAEEIAPPESVPTLSEAYPEQQAHLREFSTENKNKRRTAYAGPGTQYAESGAYLPYKQRGITTLFTEGEWVLVHLRYQTVEDRYLYFKASWFDAMGEVPQIDTLYGFPGKTTAAVTPAWGPGAEYSSASDFRVSAGARVSVFFQENGYLYAEMLTPKGYARAWLPAEAVEITGPAKAYAWTAQMETDTRRVAGERQESDALPAATGEWSPWTDTPVAATDAIEVETRTLYRRQNEIESWSEWHTGTPPAADDLGGMAMETRTSRTEDGSVQTQWRVWGYNHQYGDWSDWSENPFASVVSSSDRVEEKTQYRYRLK